MTKTRGAIGNENLALSTIRPVCPGVIAANVVSLCSKLYTTLYYVHIHEYR